MQRADSVRQRGTLQRAGTSVLGDSSFGWGAEDEEAELLVATDAAKTITTLLSSLVLNRNEKAMSGPMAWCSVVGNRGLTFSVVVANTLQATVALPKSLFTRWRLQDEDGSEGLGFGVNLGILLECLRVLTGSDNQTLCLSYNGSKASLKLTMVDGAAVTDCTVATLDMDEIPECSAPQYAARVMIDSAKLSEALTDFQCGGDDKDKPRLRLRAGLQPPQLSLTVATSELGCEIVYPPQALSTFEVSGQLEAEYSFALVRSALKSLKESDQTCLRLSDDGLLHISVRIASAEFSELFVNFLIAPLTPEDDVEEAAHLEASTGDAAAENAHAAHVPASAPYPDVPVSTSTEVC